MSAQKETQIKLLADQLYHAQESCRPIDAITRTNPEIDIEDAYRIQLLNVDRMLANGERISGKKIGLTSFAMQQLLGVDEPDYGHLFESMNRKDGKFPAQKMLQPKVEGEIAFILKEDLAGPNVTPEQVIAATDYVTAALEIVDSRVRDWKIKLVDTVADNASSGMYVLGSVQIKAGQISLPDIEMSLYQNGKLVNSGKGTDVLEDPAICVAWLANKLAAYNVILKKGEVVLSGALSAAIPAQKGDRFEARFTHLGNVSAEFI